MFMEDAKKFKELLGNKAKNIIADNLGFVEKNGKVKCPLHNDKNPSMSWFEKGLMWRCHACNGQIDIYKYFMDYEKMTFIEAVEEVKDLIGMKRKSISANRTKYKTPKLETKELTKEFIDYMAKRRISKSTLDFWDVKQGIWNSQNVYVFSYYDVNNKLVYVTYRGLGNKAIKGGCEPNTKPILWGINHIDKTKPLVITEGQPDAMAVWQSGYKNVVSVPSGCNNFKWIDNN